MREVLPHRDVSGGAVTAAGGETDVDGSDAVSDASGPAVENVGDYADRGSAVGGGDAGGEVAGGGFEGSGGVEEGDNLGERHMLGVLCVGG